MLASAQALFARGGLERTTIEATSADFGVSNVTIYKRWPNKTAVALDAFAEMMSREVIIPDQGSVRDDFIAELNSMIHFYASPAGQTFAELLAASQSGAAMLTQFRQRFLTGRRRLVSPYRGMQFDGVKSGA